MEILGVLLAIIIGFAIFAVVWDVFIIIAAISIMITPIIIGLILCVFIWSSGHDNIAVMVLLACFFLEYPWINFAKDNKMLDKLGEFFIPLG
uniref:hypothetical protein n=1 Tax=Candidatus Electronema sp. TaxID=2698783 RepID=UPI0040568901